MIKKGRDLKPGDVILKPYYELVLEVDLEPKPGEFWTVPNISFFDLNDSYYGPSGRELKLDEEFEIATEREDIRKAFRQVECDLSNYISERLEDRIKLSELSAKVFTEMNRKAREHKNENNYQT